MSAEKWFHRGKDARRRGDLRVIRDGRMSIASRHSYLEGWDEQDRLINPPTAAQIAESRRVAGKLRDFAKTLKGKS